MLWFFVFLIIPVLWITFAKIKFHTFSWKEAGIQFGISLVMCVVLASGTLASRYTGTMDTEILNGTVTDKHSDIVSCAHSYEECTTVNGKRRCTTYYEHNYDVDWVVDTSVGTLKISRVDRQGVIEPPRFSKVTIGEPASLENTYVNYVKAVPESIFNASEFSNNDYVFPRYPSVYDYYRINHVVNAGANVPSETISKWNKELKKVLESLGSMKQVNVVLVLTDKDPSYADNLEYEWLKGKKNDVVVVLGIHDDHVEWAKSFGWSKTTRVFYELDDALSGMRIDDDIVGLTAEKIQEFYVRQPFDEYQYLIDEVSPPIWALVLMFIVNVVITGVIGHRFVTNDGVGYNRSRRRY